MFSDLYIPPKPAIIRPAEKKLFQKDKRILPAGFMLNPLVSFGPIQPSQANFVDSFTRTLNANVALGTGYFIRIVVQASEISTSGSQVKVRFEAATTDSLVIQNAWIGPQGAGDAWNFSSGAQRRLLFSGANGVTISSSASLDSDPLTYTLNEAVNQVIHIQANATGSWRRLTSTSNVGIYYKSGTDDGTDTGGGGMTTHATNEIWGINRIQVA